MDTYIKLDQTLSELLAFLDEELDGNYLLFLTADHGAAENREELAKMGVPSGHLDMKMVRSVLDHYLDSLLGEEDWIEATSNLNIYFTQELLVEGEEEGYEREDVIEQAYHFLKKQEGIANVYVPEIADAEDFLIPMTARGFHAHESGDLVIIEKPNWNSFWRMGSGHESPYSYDTHVPLLIFGEGVSSKELFERYAVSDIIPSLATQLGIPMTDGVKDFKLIPLK
jgi:arylsulfatase A-like enzyme